MPVSDTIVDARSRSRMAARYRCLAVASISMLVTGCSYTGGVRDYVRNGFKVGPNYCKPAAPVADTWIDEYDQRVVQELPNYADWWTVFNDQPLNEIMENVYRQNLPLKVAGLRVLEARYLRAIAIGSLFPQQQQTTGAYSRTQVSANIANSPPVRFFDSWSTGVNAFWEVDIWGKFRRNIESADANLEASVEEYDALMICLLAEAASAYVDLRTFQQRLEYAESNVTIQEGSLDIAEANFKNGAVSKLDVTQATTNLENTRRLILQFENQIRLANNRLCVVLGIPPRDLTPELGPGPIPVPPADVVVGMPANLLRRRPDVRAAERRVAQQSAQIGVAAADLLPHFSLAGSIGLNAAKFSNLFSSGSWAAVVSPGYAWDILNYGRLWNNVRVQDAVFQQLAVTYQQAVLQANAEVESSVSTFLNSQDELVHVRAATEASLESVEIAELEYREGAIDFNRVFNLQLALVVDQDSLAAVQGNIANALIGTYKALGGGWEIRLGIRRGAPPAEVDQQQPEPATDQDTEQLPAPDKRVDAAGEPSADEEPSADDEPRNPDLPPMDEKSIEELLKEAEELGPLQEAIPADQLPAEDVLPSVPEDDLGEASSGRYRILEP